MKRFLGILLVLLMVCPLALAAEVATLEEARELYNAGQYDEALEALLAIEAATYNLLGQVYNRQGDGKAAVAAHKQALALEPENIDYLYRYGWTLLESGNDQNRAKTTGNQMVELAPDNAKGYDILGVVARNKNDYETQLTYYEKAVELDPEDTYYRYTLALTLSMVERYDEALEALDALIELDPTHAYAYNGKAYVLSVLGRLEEAAESVRKATELEPSNPEHWNRLTTLLTNLDLLQECYDVSSECAALNPDSAWALQKMAVACYNMGKINESRKNNEAALAIDPENALALEFAEKFLANATEAGESPVSIEAGDGKARLSLTAKDMPTDVEVNLESTPKNSAEYTYKISFFDGNAFYQVGMSSFKTADNPTHTRGLFDFCPLSRMDIQQGYSEALCLVSAVERDGDTVTFVLEPPFVDWSDNAVEVDIDYDNITAFGYDIFNIVTEQKEEGYFRITAEGLTVPVSIDVYYSQGN